MNNLLPYTRIGKSHSQAAVQMLLFVAFARELFPRSEGRGSIEAIGNPDNAYRLRGFPRSEGRGSIEAYQAPWLPCQPTLFPRSEGRGSIEACCGPGR
jgi:hypothetical protein